MVNEMKKNIPTVTGYFAFSHGDEKFDGYISYEEALAKANPKSPM
jgi:hypothetical protein